MYNDNFLCIEKKFEVIIFQYGFLTDKHHIDYNYYSYFMPFLLNALQRSRFKF